LQPSGDGAVWWAEAIRKKSMENEVSGEGGELVGIIDKNEMKEIQKLLKVIMRQN